MREHAFFVSSPPPPLFTYLVRQNAAPDLGRRLLGQRPRHKLLLVGQQLDHDFRRLRRGRQRAADQGVACSRRAARAGRRQGSDRGLQAGGGVGGGVAVATLVVFRLTARLAARTARVGAPPPRVFRALLAASLPPSRAPVQHGARVAAAARDGGLHVGQGGLDAGAEAAGARGRKLGGRGRAHVLHLGVHAAAAGDVGHARDAQRDLFVAVIGGEVGGGGVEHGGEVGGGGVEHGGEGGRSGAGDRQGRRAARHGRRRARTIVAIIRR